MEQTNQSILIRYQTTKHKSSEWCCTFTIRLEKRRFGVLVMLSWAPYAFSPLFSRCTSTTILFLDPSIMRSEGSAGIWLRHNRLPARNPCAQNCLWKKWGAWTCVRVSVLTYVCELYLTRDSLDQSEIVTPSLEHSGHLRHTRSRREAGENSLDVINAITYICFNILHNECIVCVSAIKKRYTV